MDTLLFVLFVKCYIFLLKGCLAFSLHRVFLEMAVVTERRRSIARKIAPCPPSVQFRALHSNHSVSSG